MARTRFLELPEELFIAIENASLAQGKTPIEWLINNLPLSSRSEESLQELSESDKKESEAQSELWLTHL